MKLTLTRVLTDKDRGTFGVLSADYPLCVTIERPWINNENGISCIPEGEYEYKSFNGSKWKNVWEITGVPNRSAILIHAGNSMHDVEGCVAVGERFYNSGVLHSQDTLDFLRKILPKSGTIVVKNAY